MSDDATGRPDSAGDVLAGYREQGLAGRLGFGRSPALLVVDLQRGFTEGDSPLGMSAEREIEGVARLIRAARDSGAPVLFTVTGYGVNPAEGGLFVKKVPSLKQLRWSERWTQLDPRLPVADDDVVIRKQYASAFFGTPLASTLRALGVDTLLIVGCTTSGCIRATAVDALQLGFRPVVPRQCVFDRAREPHAANLVDIEGKYGDVVDLARVLAYLDELRVAEAAGASKAAEDPEASEPAE